MVSVRKTIILAEQEDSWAEALIEAGRRTNDSEHIRDLILREQDRSAGVDAIRTALIVGEASGEPLRFDVAVFKQRIHSAQS